MATDLIAEMDRDFEGTFDATQDWVLDPDERVRATACLACAQKPDASDIVRVRRLLSRLELFMADASPVVEEVVGPQVIASLLVQFPTVAYPWLKEWAVADEETVRANIARSLGGEPARLFPMESVDVLELLAVDMRPKVRTAVIDAFRQIVAARPEMRGYVLSHFSGLISRRTEPEEPL
ncbi:MAG: hypothetical protein L3K09_01385 [Thermoplasmata archaeon]|nr:hypothetical protein [Thermoplasmata archaeon]